MPFSPDVHGYCRCQPTILVRARHNGEMKDDLRYRNVHVIIGTIFEFGTDTVESDAAKAVQMYNQVIEEGGEESAMYRLAFLTTMGGAGLNSNPKRG